MPASVSTPASSSTVCARGTSILPVVHSSMPSMRNTGSHAFCDSKVPKAPGDAPMIATCLPPNTSGMSAAVTLRLHVEALGGVAALLLDGRAQLGISGPAVSEHPDLERLDAGRLQLIPVASPDHPLARADKLPPGAARAHLQLVLTDRSNLTEGRDFTVASHRTWRLADLGAKLWLLRGGIGWGNMPAGMIEDDPIRGRLVKLPLEDMSAPYPLTALWRRDHPPGHATDWLLKSLIQALSV